MKVKFTVEKKDVVALQYIYADYYGLKVPAALIRKCLPKHWQSAREACAGCYGDTAAREYFIDALTEFLKISGWPANCQGEEYANKFWAELRAAAEKHGIKDATEKDVETFKARYKAMRGY